MLGKGHLIGTPWFLGWTGGTSRGLQVVTFYPVATSECLWQRMDSLPFHLSRLCFGIYSCLLTDLKSYFAV